MTTTSAGWWEAMGSGVADSSSHDRRPVRLPVAVARTGLRAGVITAMCVVAGIAFQWFLLDGQALWTYLDLPADSDMSTQSGWLGLQIAFGVLGLSVLPWALRHDERELESADEPSPGPRRALVCGLVCIASSAVSPLAAFGGLAALISLTSRRSAVWVVSAATGYVVATGLATVLDPVYDFTLDLLVTPVVVALLALMVGVIRGRRREKRWRLIASANLNELRSRVREEEARREERTRIARDMHDTLSHRLSLIAVHAGALEYRDDLARAAIRREAGIIREQAELSVADLRSVLTVLRDSLEATDPRASVEDLAATSRAAGTSVTVTQDVTSGQLAALSTVSVHTVHRAVQEALTNARKHAPGQPVTIHLFSRRRVLVVSITNPVAHARSPGGGLGLIGVRERAQLVGGRLTVTRTDDRFIVELEIPWPR